MDKYCLTCNKKFHTYPSRVKIGKGKYCSRKCESSSRQGKPILWTNLPKEKTKDIREKIKLSKLGINNSMYGKHSKNYGRVLVPIKKCLFCKKDFPAYKNSKGIRKQFCSKKCSKTEDFNPMYNNKISIYHKYLKNSANYRKWRKSVLDRDNFTCQMCGIKLKIMDVDHIKPFSLFPELRLSIENGRTLCHPCHMKTDTYGGRVYKLR